jgi:hypothetical protein
MTTRTVSPLIDDVYITLVYAKNLALGKGFVFNHGAPTLGTTTPLWAMLNAIVTQPFGVDALPRVVLWFSAVCGALSPWLVFLGHKLLRLSPGEAAITGVFLAGSFYPNYGGESNLFQLLLLGLLLATVAQRYALAGVLGALLFLTRGEGALAVLLVGFHALYTGEGLRAKFLNGLRLSAGFWALILPWFVYAWRQFGHLFPATLASKMKQGEDPRWPPFPTGLLPELTGRWSVEWVEGLPGQVLYWSLISLGLVILFRRRSALARPRPVECSLLPRLLRPPRSRLLGLVPHPRLLATAHALRYWGRRGDRSHHPFPPARRGVGGRRPARGRGRLLSGPPLLDPCGLRQPHLRHPHLRLPQRREVDPRERAPTARPSPPGRSATSGTTPTASLSTSSPWSLPRPCPTSATTTPPTSSAIFQPDYYLLAVWLANDPMQHAVLVDGGYACMTRIDADKDASRGVSTSAYLYRRATPAELSRPRRRPRPGRVHPRVEALAAVPGIGCGAR